MSGADILVVEDDPVVARAAAMVCEGEGLSADVVERADPALELLRRRAYRLVLCDIMMSDRDGFSFLAEAARRGSRVPVVMTTGYATVENAVRAMTAGAVDFIAKPFTADELLAVVRRGLRWGEGPRAPERWREGARRLGLMSWVAPLPDGTALVGAGAAFVRSAGPLASVALSAPGTEVAQGLPCAEFSAADGLVHRLMSPLSGRVLETNRAAERPGPVAEDPHFEGWLYRVAPSDPGFELGRLAACAGGLETTAGGAP